MIKVVSAISVFAFAASALFVLPGFAPPPETKRALQKADRLLSRAVPPDCSKQEWPNFSATCLHGKGEIQAVRLIGVRG
jgi:hypothetical protein